ncbi:MAG: hypothetical protein IPK72_19375 [Candidatus Eisenbacteria bacterium]|nr:hypothetical protein [Candidatus Eisenbacteria bacterium]
MASRPLDPVYPIVYLDALREASGRAVPGPGLGITTEGEGCGALAGRSGRAKFWLTSDRLKNRGAGHPDRAWTA